MATFRRAVFAALAGALCAFASPAWSAGEPPKIARPKPAVTPPAGAETLPPASLDSSLAIEGQEIKAKKVESRLSVDVQVNGEGPYHFIVDSGADTSVVGLKIAKALELPLGQPAILNGMTSRSLVDRVKVDELKLGDSIVRNLDLPALREVDLGGDGLIGIDALTAKRLMLDFERKLIKVEDPRTFERRYPGEIVVIARRHRGQLILTEVKAAGLPLDAVIDTGTEITIGNLALRDKLIRGNKDKFVTVPIIGVTGETANLQVARIAELRIGQIVLNDIPIAFADLPPFKLFGLADEPALLLGTDLLESFKRISLDFKSRKVRFQLRQCKSQGIVISTDPENFSRISSTAPEVCG